MYLRAVLSCIAGCFALMAMASSTQAQQASPASTAEAGMVEWLDQAVAPSRPQTDEEKAAGMKVGRALPEPELLQPTLDPTLPAYEKRRDVTLKGDFKAASSDVLPGLVQLWVAGFQKLYPNVHIVLSPPYAGSLGAKELVDGKLDMVFVSRELKPDDITGFQAKFGYPPLSVPITGGTYRHYGFLDAVGFLVNPDNPISKLSFAQLDAIFSTTHARGGAAITTWGQLGLTGDWADKPIHLYGIKPWNGFEEFVRQRVLSTSGQRGEWRTDINFSETVFPVAHAVAGDKYGIGYSGLAYIDAPVKMLPLQTEPGQPYYAPTYTNVARATYPLSRVTFLNTNKNPAKPLDPALAEFLRYILSRDGQQKVLDQALYVPLRGAQIENSRKLLN